MASRKWCVVDAEGNRGGTGLLGVAFYSDELQSYITDHDEIRQQLLTHASRGYTFVAHNASYDLPVIFWALDIPMKAKYYNDTFTHGEWKWSPKRPAAQLWDSLNLSGNIALAELGRALGLPKYETPQRLRGIDPDRYEWICDRHEVGECVECYAIRDAEIVYRYMENHAAVLANWGIAPQRRIAGAATAVWKELDRPGKIGLDDGSIRHLARSAYFGGRVECFKLGHIAPLFTADVASMYASVMLETGLPDPAHMVFCKGPAPSNVPWDREGVAEAQVHVPHSYLPPLPNVAGGQRIFGTGLQRGFWTFVELRHAIAQGVRVLRVYRAAWSTNTVHPFTTFVGVLWELRQEYKRTNDPRAQAIKVLLNSCYGRLGLRAGGSGHVEMPWPKDFDYTTIRGAEPYRLGDQLFIRYKTKMPTDNSGLNVLWAATITAAARVKLHQYLLLQGSAVVYCDTDSVFSTAPILGLSDGLGSLTDAQQYQSATIAGPKLYSLTQPSGEVLTKAKGIPRDLALRFLRGEEVVFQSPIKPKSQRYRGMLAGEWVDIHRERGLVPHRRTPLNPAALDTDYGWSDTIPHSFGGSG